MPRIWFRQNLDLDPGDLEVNWTPIICHLDPKGTMGVQIRQIRPPYELMNKRENALPATAPDNSSFFACSWPTGSVTL